MGRGKRQEARGKGQGESGKAENKRRKAEKTMKVEYRPLNIERRMLLLAWLLAGWCCYFLRVEARAAELSPEALLFMEVPVVVTASLKEQPVSEAPAAVTVISAEEIRQSGALTVPDVLRMVSGVDVVSISARDQQVGIRGFAGPVHNKVLVMVDGRTVYTDFVGDVYWQALPVGMEEIERIEVIKSPISSLYGANAFSGVINIITREPGRIDGTESYLTAGNHDTGTGYFLHGRDLGVFRYKFSAGFDRTEVWESGDEEMQLLRGNFYLARDLGVDHSLSFAGGRTNFQDLRLFVNEMVGTMRQQGDLDYLQAEYRNKRLLVRALLKSEDLEAKVVRTGLPDWWDMESYNFEARYSLNPGRRHALNAGIEYRYYDLAENIPIPADHSQNLYAFFLEDEVAITENWHLTAGGRYDHHPLAGGHLSPRASLLFIPTPERSFRLSVSKAFRNPSFLDSYMHIVEQAGPPLIISSGNPDLESEGVTAYEAGLRTAFLKKGILELNFFYNRYADLFITAADTTFFGPDELFPGAPGGVVPKRIVIHPRNGGVARGLGGELDLHLAVTSRLSTFANYSYQQITDDEDNPFTRTVNERDRVRTRDPRHKVNVGFQIALRNGLSMNLYANWVDATKRLIIAPDGTENLAGLDAYTLVNCRLGYAFLREKAEVSLYVFNIFNDRHFEYPPGLHLPDRSSTEIGRKIAAKLSLRF